MKIEPDKSIRVFSRLILECQKCERRIPVLAVGPPHSPDRYWSFEPDGEALALSRWLLPTTTPAKPVNPICLCGDCRPKESP